MSAENPAEVRPRVTRASLRIAGVSGSLDARDSVTLLPEPDRRELWCPIISADDHVLEPPDLFLGRVPRAMADRAPFLVEDEDGLPYWVVDDAHYPITIANGSAGRPPREWKNTPQRFEDFRPGVADPCERVKDMDLNGVWASLCFPSLVWGFAGRVFSAMRETDLGLACVRAYNDWMIEEWCGSQPDRFVPCQVPWLNDPAVAAREVLANAERGFRAVTFPETPDRLGAPSIYSGEWDAFFRACEDTQTVINLHVGSSGWVQRPSTDSPVDVAVVLFPVCGLGALVDWLFARVPLRFPRIRIVLSEAGVSWVPMMMERLARSHRHVDASDVWRSDDPHPNDVVRRNFWFTSIEDPSAFRLLDVIGDDRVLLESDYPHADSTWPDTQALLESQLGHLDGGTIKKLAYQNAAQLYRHPLPPAEWITRSAVGRQAVEA